MGAKRAGGRWNSRGNAVVYASDSLALSALEVLVHVTVEQQPPDLVAIPAEIPDEVTVKSYDVDEMPDGWRRVTGHVGVVRLGNQWLEAKDSAVLVVPSVVIPQEHNVLLNPQHPQFEAVKVGEPLEFSFDERLFGG